MFRFKAIFLFCLFILVGCAGEEVELPTEDDTAIEDIDSDADIVGKDGAPMMLVPAGEFEMGDHYALMGMPAAPVHTVYTDAFYIDKYEVTVALYLEFMKATDYGEPEYWRDLRFNIAKQPVIGVSWHEANAYCKWAGKRLPTEAEWEKAARGGLVGKIYPWGSKWDASRANNGSNTRPVGSFAPNDYGLYDMIGNVWEWCADWYDSDYYSSSPWRNPTGPSSGTDRVMRGGGIGGGYTFALSVAHRGNGVPTATGWGLGFRCVQDVTP